MKYLLLIGLATCSFTWGQTVDYIQQIKNKPYIDAIQGGADRTGVRDSAAAINTALAKGSVLLPAGTYKLTSAALAIPSNTCLQGVGDATVLSVTGTHSAISIVATGSNIASPCVKNLAISSAATNDVILLSSTSAYLINPLIENVHITAIADGQIGIHTVAGVSTSCSVSGKCIFFPTFNNVNIDGGSGAPAVGTRIGYQLDGDTAGNIRVQIQGGSVRNVKQAFNGNQYTHLFMFGTEFDGICTGSCDTTGSGRVFYLNGIGAQAATIFARVETGEVDQIANLTASSYFNTLNIDLEGGGGLAARFVDNGSKNSLIGSDGDVNDPTVVHDYNLRAQYLGNLVLPSPSTIKVAGNTNGTITVGGAAATSTQLGGLSAVETTTAPNSNFGFPTAEICDSAGRCGYWVTRDFDGATVGSNLQFRVPPGANGIVSIIPGQNGVATAPYMSIGANGVSGTGLRLGTMTLAQITTAAPPNGTSIYCSDCKNVINDSVAAGATCVGSGSGALARRENGHTACN